MYMREMSGRMKCHRHGKEKHSKGSREICSVTEDSQEQLDRRDETVDACLKEE